MFFLHKKILALSSAFFFLCLFALFAFSYSLTPDLSALQRGKVSITQWKIERGAIKVIIGPKEKDWITLEEISRHLQNAIIVAEDARFYEHHGIDIREIFLSTLINWNKGSYIRGASTITQQVVKLCALGKEKTLLRKAKEIIGALYLERMLSKDEILAWYLNLVDFGFGNYGAKQASQFYFSTNPELLTIEQAIHLVMMLPSPNRLSKELKNKELSPYSQKKFALYLDRMLKQNLITAAQWEYTLTTGNFGKPIKR